MVDALYIFAVFPCIALASLGVALVYGLWAIHLIKSHASIALIPLVVGLTFLALAISIDHMVNLYSFLITEANSQRTLTWTMQKVITKIAYVSALLLCMFTYWRIRLQLVSWGIPRCTATWALSMLILYMGSVETIDWLRGVIR